MGNDKRTRVLMLIGYLKLAGTPVHLFELVTHLDPAQFDVEICCFRKEGELVPRIEALGIPVHEVKLPSIYHPRFLPSLAKLASFVRRGRYDVTHSFLFSADVFGSLAARLGGAAAVVNSRRMMATDDAPRRAMAYRIANRWVDRVVTPCLAARCSCIRAESVDPAKVVAVYNGIDLSRVGAAEATLDFPAGRGPWLGAVGALTPIKGHRTLVDSLPAIRARHPGAQVVIAGTGHLQAELQARAVELGVRDAVHFLGVRDDIPSLLPRLDLFVLPSNSEGLSNALLEAMGSRLAVVATDVGGNSEALEHDVTGLLVPPGDPVAMSLACCELLDDDARRHTMGQQGRRRVEEQFTVERMAAEVGDLYHRLTRPADSPGSPGSYASPGLHHTP